MSLSTLQRSRSRHISRACLETLEGRRLMSSTTAGDVNADGVLDLVSCALTYSDPYSGYELDTQLGNGDGTFAAPVHQSISGEFAAGPIAFVDLNADGKLDVVMTSTYVGSGGLSFDGYESLHVLLGQGDGTFAYRNRYDFFYAWGNETWFSSLAIADFDSDGKLDLATGGGSPSPCVKFFRGTGDGSLQAPRESAADIYATSLTVGDFNGDARPDLMTVADDGSSILLGSGDGLFWPALSPTLPTANVHDVTVTEGNTGAASATFTVTLSTASAEAVALAYATADGIASASSDYRSTSGTLTFAPGETSKTVTVLVAGDRLAEPGETFAVNLTAATNATIGDGQGIGTILDDEPRISIGDVSRLEGKNGRTTQFTFTATLSAAYDQPVTASFRTADGTARMSDRDYTAKAGTITFNPGETSKTVSIEVRGDNKREANEAFYLDLLDASSNARFARSRGIGTILNDD
jgi:hypothetical protein